jgi:hypothetical protein
MAPGTSRRQPSTIPLWLHAPRQVDASRQKVGSALRDGQLVPGVPADAMLAIVISTIGSLPSGWPCPGFSRY